MLIPIFKRYLVNSLNGWSKNLKYSSRYNIRILIPKNRLNNSLNLDFLGGDFPLCIK